MRAPTWIRPEDFRHGQRPRTDEGFLKKVGYDVRNLVAGGSIFPGGESGKTATGDGVLRGGVGAQRRASLISPVP